MLNGRLSILERLARSVCGRDRQNEMKHGGQGNCSGALCRLGQLEHPRLDDGIGRANFELAEKFDFSSTRLFATWSARRDPLLGGRERHSHCAASHRMPVVETDRQEKHRRGRPGRSRGIRELRFLSRPIRCESGRDPMG